MTRVLVADNHRLFRTGLVALLQQNLASDTAIVEVGSFNAARVAVAKEVRFDAVFLDLDMLRANTGPALDDFLTAADNIPVCVMTRSGRSAELTASRGIDTNQHIHVVESFNELIGFLETATAGTRYADWGSNLGVDLATADLAPSSAGLTPTETQVLLSICQGCSNKKIARHHGVSHNAIKIHTRNIFAKLGVHNRTQAAMLGASRITKGITECE